MSERERNFSNFYLNDNVYELADGVIPELAERLNVRLSGEPNSEELKQLVDAVGPNKVTRDNKELTEVDRETQLDLVERSGIQNELDRSLWTPEHDSSGAQIMVQTDAVANWMDRGLTIATDYVLSKKFERRTMPEVVVSAGNRVMKSGTERSNENIQTFLSEHGRYPTGAEYSRDYLSGGLNDIGISSVTLAVESADGQDVAAKLFEKYPELLESKIVFARVANAGIQLALQMRQAARRQNPSFDADPANPQVFIRTDSFPLARNPEQEDTPQKYQKAATALRQLAVTAKMLTEVQDNPINTYPEPYKVMHAEASIPAPEKQEEQSETSGQTTSFGKESAQAYRKGYGA